MNRMPEKSFADCCNAGPLELLIEREEDGAVIARGSLEQPFALIGRDPYCDIHLNDPAVALRHAIIQMLGGHLFIIDLASTTGVHWPAGRAACGWLMPGEPLRIGPFRLFLTRSAALHPSVHRPDFQPLTANDAAEGLPKVNLEFLTGKTDRTGWEVNRVLTLVGRANECKLHLGGEDIALFHSYFVKTAAGLWVVDLLARGGTKVNGNKVRHALLNDGDEVQVGKFAMGVRYPKPEAHPAKPEDSAVSFDVEESRSMKMPGSSLSLKSSARIGKPEEEEPPPPDQLQLLREVHEMQRTMIDQWRTMLGILRQTLDQTDPKPDAPETERRSGLWQQLLGQSDDADHEPG